MSALFKVSARFVEDMVMPASSGERVDVIVPFTSQTDTLKDPIRKHEAWP